MIFAILCVYLKQVLEILMMECIGVFYQIQTLFYVNECGILNILNSLQRIKHELNIKIPNINAVNQNRRHVF